MEGERIRSDPMMMSHAILYHHLLWGITSYLSSLHSFLIRSNSIVGWPLVDCLVFVPLVGERQRLRSFSSSRPQSNHITNRKYGAADWLLDWADTISGVDLFLPPARPQRRLASLNKMAVLTSRKKDLLVVLSSGDDGFIDSCCLKFDGRYPSD